MEKIIIPVQNTDEVSDGYHTFGELYDHRTMLFIALLKSNKDKFKIWFSERHSDGSKYDNWIIAGINEADGEQITYHISDYYRYLLEEIGAEELEFAPEFDGHTSNDVLRRLEKMIFGKLALKR